MRSISRVPRCQQRNNSRLRRSSRPSLDRVDPVILLIHPNGKSPDVPGAADIAMGKADVSTSLREISTVLQRCHSRTRLRDLAACFARGFFGESSPLFKTSGGG